MLRHGKGPAPAWVAALLGPFLLVAGALATLSIIAEPLTLGATVQLIATIAIAAVGLWLSIDYFSGLIRNRERKDDP